MSTVTMSLYQAIEKKKILDDQVKNVQSNLLVVVRKANDEVTKDGIPLDKILANSIQPGYQKSVALMKNLIALKAAINEANAKITIDIGGKTYTMANAIVLYRNCDKLINLYQRMVGNYQSTQDAVEKLNAKSCSNDAINAYLEKTLGSGKRDPEMIERLTKDYIARNTYAVYDPLNTLEKAPKEIEELERFKDEMHYKMNKANIENEITVEFED